MKVLSLVLLAVVSLSLSGCATMNAVQSLLVSSKVTTGHDEKNNREFVDGIVKVGGLLSSWEALHFSQSRSLTTGKVAYSFRLDANETTPKLYDKAVFYIDGQRVDWVPPTVLSSRPESYFDGVNIYYRSSVPLTQGESTVATAEPKNQVIGLAQSLVASSDASLKIFEANSNLTTDYKFTAADRTVVKQWLDTAAKAAMTDAIQKAPAAPKNYATAPWAKIWSPSFADDYNGKDVKVEGMWIGPAKQMMNVTAGSAPYNSGDWVEVGVTTKDDVKNVQVGQYPNQYWAIYVPKDNSDLAFSLGEGKSVVLYGTARKVIFGGTAVTVLELDRIEAP